MLEVKQSIPEKVKSAVEKARKEEQSLRSVARRRTEKRLIAASHTKFACVSFLFGSKGFY